MLRLLAITLALGVLLSLSGLLEWSHCDGEHHDAEPVACVCLCHAGIAVLPDLPALIVPGVTAQALPLAAEVRRPQDALRAIDPPPDKRAG